jgi:hypothetical protein
MQYLVRQGRATVCTASDRRRVTLLEQRQVFGGGCPHSMLASSRAMNGFHSIIDEASLSLYSFTEHFVIIR